MLEMAERKEVGARGGALRNGRFPVQTLVMIDENARGGGAPQWPAFPLQQ